MIPSDNTPFTGICVSQTASRKNPNKDLSLHPAYGLSFNTFETPEVLEPADEFLYFFHPPPRQSLTESCLLQDTTWRWRISGMSTSCALRPTQKMHDGLSSGGSEGVRPGRPLLRKLRKPLRMPGASLLRAARGTQFCSKELFPPGSGQTAL